MALALLSEMNNHLFTFPFVKHFIYMIYFFALPLLKMGFGGAKIYPLH